MNGRSGQKDQEFTLIVIVSGIGVYYVIQCKGKSACNGHYFFTEKETNKWIGSLLIINPFCFLTLTLNRSNFQ